MRFKESIKTVIRRSPGSEFWRKINVTSSSIKTATATDISVAATGDLAIRQIIVMTDATGLAGGTNFQILSNNAFGVANILVETVANLGANKQVVLSGNGADADTTTSDATPSVTALQGVLQAGKKLQVQNSAADGTGAGIAAVYILFQRIDENADVFMVGSSI